MPAVSASRASINDLLRRGSSRVGGTSNRGRFSLIVLEVALSVVLLAGAGLLIRSYLQLAAVDPGFSAATLTFRLNPDDVYNKPEQRTALYKGFLEKLQNIPGVKYAGATSAMPLSSQESMTFVEIRGFGKPKEMLENRSVTPDYRKALGTPLLRGRDFNAHDVSSKTPVAMVNEKFAAMFFHGRDPLGVTCESGSAIFPEYLGRQLSAWSGMFATTSSKKQPSRSFSSRWITEIISPSPFSPAF
jgi:putative ABC transport system permease protein